MSEVVPYRPGALESFLSRHGRKLWVVFVALGALYVLVPPILLVIVSFESSGVVRLPQGFTLRWYAEMFTDIGLMNALFKSIGLALLTVVIAVFLALQVALGYRKTKHKTLVIAIMILPIFLPGMIQGFSLSILLTQFLGVQRTFLTELIGHISWALPFAFLVILTSMSAVQRETVMAAMDLGANPWQAFRDIEYPIIKPGLISAAIFSFVLSFNEFSRTFYLQGIGPTVPTFVFNKITVDITPEIFALSALTVVLSLGLIALGTLYLTFVGRAGEEVSEAEMPADMEMPGKAEKPT